MGEIMQLVVSAAVCAVVTALAAVYGARVWRVTKVAPPELDELGSGDRVLIGKK